MIALGLRPSGRSGPSPGRRRPLALPFLPAQLTGLAFSHKAGEPQNTVTGGAIRQAAGGFRTQAAIVLGADHNARPFDHAEADVLGVVAATKLLCAADEQEPIGWAGAMWGM